MELFFIQLINLLIRAITKLILSIAMVAVGGYLLFIIELLYFFIKLANYFHLIIYEAFVINHLVVIFLFMCFRLLFFIFIFRPCKLG